MIKKLGLKNPIVCGASMAGQISLACAIRADEVGCIGTIPLQGSDFLDMKRQWYDQTPHHNQSLFNPEWIYGVSLTFTPRATPHIKVGLRLYIPDDVPNCSTRKPPARLAFVFRASLRHLPRRFGHVLRWMGRKITNV